MVVLVDGRFRWIKVILKDLIVRQVDGSSLNWHHKIELGSFRACNFDQIRAKCAEIGIILIDLQILPVILHFRRPEILNVFEILF